MAKNKPTLNTLGQRLRNARLAAGLTQQALAKKLKLGRYGNTVISSYEADRRAPRVDKLVQFCKATGCSLQTIIQ